MRKLTLVLALAASTVAGQAAADVFFFDTVLSGANEEPPNGSPGTGISKLQLDTDLHTMRLIVQFADLTGTTSLAHVHAPTSSPNTGLAGVATALPSFPAFPTGVTSGSYDHTFDTSDTGTWNPTFITANGGTALGAESGFLAALLAEKAYLNIHTSFLAGGEIRGFYSLSPVPEPGAWALSIMGFGLAGAMLRRRPASSRARMA